MNESKQPKYSVNQRLLTFLPGRQKATVRRVVFGKNGKK